MIFNTAAVFNQGKLVALVPKSYLPNYDEFKEKIYFQRALNKTFFIEVDNFDYHIIFGKHILFTYKNWNEYSFGIEICED